MMVGILKDEKVMARKYGQYLKRRRHDRGITICELSERTKISQGHIAGAELGILELSGLQKRRIAKFLRRQKII